MKKQLSLFVWAVAVFGMAPVWAATNSTTYSSSSAGVVTSPTTRTRAAVNYEKYETRSTSKTYTVKDDKNVAYTHAQPAKRSNLYKEHDSRSASSSNYSRTTRTDAVRGNIKHKYFLAHPFFQPTKGRFGSVTDLSYTGSSYDFKINQTVADPVTGAFSLDGHKAKWDMTQFALKQDLSYGITDDLSVMGMARYDSSKYKFDWADPTAPDDSMRDSGINLYGLGLQWRFVDNPDWIAYVAGHYQRQTDVANFFIAEVKAGYKIERTTVYGLLRGWLVDFDGNSYGNGVANDEAVLFLAYDVGNSSATYFEGGAGVFSVLEEDWTLNLELVIGDYDWHNQASIKGAIGWQPGNNFALNLYAKTAIYDSADGKNLDFFWYQPSAGVTSFQQFGTAKMDNISEWTIGLQAILYF